MISGGSHDQQLLSTESLQKEKKKLGANFGAKALTTDGITLAACSWMSFSMTLYLNLAI